MNKTMDQEEHFYLATARTRPTNIYRYRIRSPLINSCIEGGEINGTELYGYTSHTLFFNFTRYYLTSIIKFAFNIHRRLGYEENFYMPTDFNHVKKTRVFEETLTLSHSISDEMFFEAVTEMRKIYEHTQYMLKKCNCIEEDGFVKVYRSLNVIELVQVLRQFEVCDLVNTNQQFNFETNILLSGEHFNEKLDITYTDGRHPLKVCFKIPAKNILMHPDFILTKHGKDKYNANSLQYENEILFLNRDPKGILSFTTKDIYRIDDDICKQYINKLNENKNEWDMMVKRYGRHSYHITEDSYYLMLDAKFFFFNNQLDRIINRLTPRLQNKVIKELNK
ncbi:hypothetical protein [Bacillus pseudomycoides]|uniref:Uncharacterized protein n=1 Tax=Bacillus pseudomycoides TaxID=64104 RepID=A0AAJ2DQ73_9BACI|nr:hypothetical protein [Bacillus pseudomycoides]MDR4329278.1 hypothetical protein [Bacillus pseudomycoides]